MKLRPAFIITAMILLLAGGVGWRLYDMFVGSSEGTVSVGTPAEEPMPTARQKIENAYASFSYSPGLQLVNTERPSTPVLANYNFRKQQFNSWQASVQITSLPSGQLRDAGTYNFRDANPDRYKKQTTRIGPHDVVLFTDQTDGSFNRIAYINSNDTVASILLAGGMPEQVEAMQAELDAIVTSWQWR